MFNSVTTDGTVSQASGADLDFAEDVLNFWEIKMRVLLRGSIVCNLVQ